MPDPKAMSGIALPVPDIPVGTVTARVIRGALTNPVPGLDVEVTGSGVSKTAKTDEAGRATFSGLTPGTRVKAVVVANGERVESREFEVPSRGGIRTMLVLTDAEIEKKAAQDRELAKEPAVPGTVVFGEQSRFVIEAGDDALNVFYILQIVNTAKRPVQTDAPLVFDLPAGAQGAGMLEGSAPNGVAAGAWGAVRGRKAEPSARRAQLQARREKLFSELTALEEQRRKGTVDARVYATRREHLVTALEDLYAGLEREVA